MAKKSYSSYGDTDPSVASASVPIVVDAPYIEQNGSTVTCTKGNWDETATPDSFSYAWTLDGSPVGGDSPNLMVTPENVGSTVACSLTATNAEGTSAASTSNEIVIEDQGWEAVPVDMDAPKTYVVVEDNTMVDDPENPGSKITKMKDEQVTLTMNQARAVIDSGARIIGID